MISGVKGECEIGFQWISVKKESYMTLIVVSLERKAQFNLICVSTQCSYTMYFESHRMQYV